MVTTRTMGWVSAGLLAAGAITWLATRRQGRGITWRRTSRKILSEAARWVGRQLLTV